MTIQCDHVIETTRPDNVVVEKENNKAIIEGTTECLLMLVRKLRNIRTLREKTMGD